MLFGWQGKILRINLSTRKAWVEQPDSSWYRLLWGGACIGVYYLLKEVPPATDPFHPDNLLIFATGPATGCPFPGFAKHSVMAKSPLTGGIGESQVEGFWGAELKKAGFDALIVQGKAESPVYIWIENEKVSINDAKFIWGLETGQAYEELKKKTHPQAKISLIGPAGEKLVRYANIVNDLIYHNFRMGMGAVMGSKNLKAIAVKGDGKVTVKEEKVIDEIARDYRQHFMEDIIPRLQWEYGTAGAVKMVYDDGQLVTCNFQTGVIEGWQDMPGTPGYKNFLKKNQGCFSCPTGCKHLLKPLTRGEIALEGIYGAPEFEAAVALGSNCGIKDTFTILKAYELCSSYGLDPCSLGGTISFVMECLEKGAVKKEDVDNLDLRFGNSHTFLQVIELIASRTGIGDLLAEGSCRVAEKWGEKCLSLAVQSKGKELPPHDPRAKAALGLGYAVSPIGPDFAVIEHDSDFDFQAPQKFIDEAGPIGIYERLPAESLSEKKVRMFYNLQLYWSSLEVICGCIFALAPVRHMKINHLVKAMRAVTGVETSLWEIMKLGERRINMFKIFNLREGFASEDDKLPPRMFEPIQTGPRKGQKLNKEDFEKARRLYYEMMGWDEKGVPREAKLWELDLAWIKEYLPDKKQIKKQGDQDVKR